MIKQLSFLFSHLSRFLIRPASWMFSFSAMMIADGLRVYKCRIVSFCAAAIMPAFATRHELMMPPQDASWASTAHYTRSLRAIYGGQRSAAYATTRAGVMPPGAGHLPAAIAARPPLGITPIYISAYFRESASTSAALTQSIRSFRRGARRALFL